MPVHLGPLSRRRFIQRATAASLGLAIGPQLAVAATSKDDDSWALLSDTHLAADRSLQFRGVNMAEHFDRVSRDLGSLPKRPAGLFLTGDCAYNSGESGDYALLEALLKPIREARIPVHLALGNHDNRERFWAAFQNERKAARPLVDRQASMLKARLANWFLLDSLEKTLSTPGLLGPEQLAWLADSLDRHTSKPAIVLVHHNPGFNGGNMGLKDTLPFLEIIRPRKQVKAYIYGHTHNWKVEQDTSGIHLINLPPVSYVFREGDPSGWVHATLTDHGIRLEFRSVDPAHKDHVELHDLPWRV